MSTRAEQRVAIAKDVIKQIKLGKIVLGGGYWDLGYYDASKSVYPNITRKVEATLPLKKTVCHVCAMGAVFASKVLKKGSTLLNEQVNDQAIIDDLEGIFSARQLRLIETAYEGGYCGNGTVEDKITTRSLQRAEDFYTTHNVDEDYSPEHRGKRMVAIMKNVISNEGTFRP